MAVHLFGASYIGHRVTKCGLVYATVDVDWGHFTRRFDVVFERNEATCKRCLRARKDGKTTCPISL